MKNSKKDTFIYFSHKSFYAFLFLISTIPSINPYELVIDTDVDLIFPVDGQCSGGYEVFQNFTCGGGQEPAIPPSDQTNSSTGFWSGCGDIACSIQYLGGSGKVAQSLKIFAYFKGESSSFRIEIRSSNSEEFFLNMSGNGWAEIVIDITTLEDFELIENIKILPIYVSPEDFTIIDRIIFEIQDDAETTTSA